MEVKTVERPVFRMSEELERDFRLFYLKNGRFLNSRRWLAEWYGLLCRRFMERTNPLRASSDAVSQFLRSEIQNEAFGENIGVPGVDTSILWDVEVSLATDDRDAGLKAGKRLTAAWQELKEDHEGEGDLVVVERLEDVLFDL